MKNALTNPKNEANPAPNHAYFENQTADMFDFNSLLQGLIETILVNKRLVAITTIFVIFLAALYQFVWPPIYRAEAVIMVERSEDAERDSFYKEWNLFRKNDARTEIELMKSGTVLKRVIEKENLGFDDVYHPVMSQISHFWEISYPGMAYKEVKSWILGPSEVDALTPEQKELGKTIRDLRAGLQVQTAGDILIGEVYAKGPHPRIYQITNTWIDTYMEWRMESLEEEAKRSIDALTQHIDKVHAEILETSTQRVKFLNENNLVFDFVRETQQVEKLVNLETEISATDTRLDTLRSSLIEINRQLADMPEQRIVSSTKEASGVRESAKSKKLELEAKLVTDLIRYRADSPEIELLLSQIAGLDSLINNSESTSEASTTTAINQVWLELKRRKSNIETELSGLTAGLASMKTIQADMVESLTRAPELAAQLRDIDRRYSVAQQVYKVLLTKRAQADVSYLSAKEAMPTLRVVDYAVPPASKSWPKAKYLYPIALIIGIILGVIAALIKSLLGNKVTVRFLESYVGIGQELSVVEVKTDTSDMPLFQQFKSRFTPNRLIVSK
ncbi:GumC family protein [Glaciecola petra]|uniref:Wzz/FepE/Etk N-terminal domain-containing protein n=1 Tax=Glaciecola petra TaxID=3075602 RepID=A0ABU2ZMX6_9ALTE|nr:Wzz/FepE/Etk N-terminal domain-containing protein [Aestuariibacter sp. P117]MDT0593766.1 Wzz/FepE/Etk N-terminal domain-containing protein [Aestuariibacter sp. P117]